jgi:hypothetical protein
VAEYAKMIAMGLNTLQYKKSQEGSQKHFANIANSI